MFKSYLLEGGLSGSILGAFLMKCILMGPLRPIEGLTMLFIVFIQAFISTKIIQEERRDG